MYVIFNAATKPPFASPVPTTDAPKTAKSGISLFIIIGIIVLIILACVLYYIIRRCCCKKEEEEDEETGGAGGTDSTARPPYDPTTSREKEKAKAGDEGKNLLPPASTDRSRKGAHFDYF